MRQQRSDDMLNERRAGRLRVVLVLLVIVVVTAALFRSRPISLRAPVLSAPRATPLLTLLSTLSTLSPSPSVSASALLPASTSSSGARRVILAKTHKTASTAWALLLIRWAARYNRSRCFVRWVTLANALKHTSGEFECVANALGQFRCRTFGHSLRTTACS